MMTQDQAPSCSSIYANLSAAATTPTSASAAAATTPASIAASTELLSAVAASTELPSWLPPGWQIETKVRTSGATAGVVDKFYLDTVSGNRFRSKKEVLYFVEFGIKREKKKENYDAGIKSLGKPKEVEWALWSENSEETETWTPYIGENKVPDSVRQDWERAYVTRAHNDRHPTDN
ncbi:hypothetical protein Dsin_019420 [Dipteronia sinensis]|uniref:MBD domain-containing protein n=1 Tax=Dipteronia sinensis TaxID=43782 RepID=A0AAE0A7W9_9ROSI|nr:hypothetical protein Dsin_019420 [Dipteronia sinensis]